MKRIQRELAKRCLQREMASALLGKEIFGEMPKPAKVKAKITYVMSARLAARLNIYCLLSIKP